MRWYLTRFTYAVAGLWHAVRWDQSFRWQLLGMGLATTLVATLTWPLGHTEWLALTGSFALILITELQNSAFESALDHLHPEQHARVGRSKDMAAGAVLLAGLCWLTIAVLILIHHFS